MQLPAVFLLGCASLMVLTAPTQAQTPPSSTPPATTPAAEMKLEELPAKLAELDQELKQQLDAFLAVVDAEEKAKRLSRPYAQSLRWSGQTAVENTSSPSSDSRSLLTTARAPSENAAIFEARAILDAAIARVSSRRLAFLSASTRMIRRELSEAFHGNATGSELKVLAERFDAMRDFSRGRIAVSSSEISNLTAASNAVNWLRRLVEAEGSHESDKMRFALQEYASIADLIPESDRRDRIARTIQPFIAKIEAAKTTLNETLENGKSAKDRDAAFSQFEEAVERLNVVAAGQSNGEAYGAAESLSAYRVLVKALAASDVGDATGAMNAFRDVRNHTQSGGKWTAWMNARLTKWETELAESTARDASERRAKLRAQLAAVKSPADLDAITDELAKRQRITRVRGGEDQEDLAQIGQQLAILATAWSTASPALLQQDRFGGNAQTGTPFAREIAALRKLVERDVLARSLRAPELNQPPLADLPPETAIEKLTDDLAKRGEWRRLHQLLQARAGFSAGEPRMAQQDLLGALQFFLAGQNFELAEQWADAIQAYKGVLRSISERAPTAAAADRVKVLAKEHPEANLPAAGAAPGRSF